MKKPLLLAIVLTFTLQFDAWSQAGAGNIVKQRARETAGRPAPPKTGQVTGQSGSSRPAATSTRRYSTRTKTPLKAIESAMSLIRIKRSLTDEHRNKLTTALNSATGDNKPNPDAVAGVGNAVANAVNKHKPSTKDRKTLAAALNQAMNAGAFDEKQSQAVIAQVKYSFSGTDASEQELKTIASGLTLVMSQQRRTTSK